MTWYIYWYFTFHSIYDYFSDDKQFDIFATGMFSLFVSSLVIGVFGFVLYYIGFQGLLLDNEIRFMIPGLSVFVINYYIFLPKRRQIRLFEIYKNNQSMGRDIFSIFISIFSVLIVVLYGIKAHDYLN